MNKIITVIFILIYTHCIYCQKIVKGNVTDKNHQPIFAANVYPKSNPQKGVITDLNGNFSLSIDQTIDTLVVSFIGYETKIIPLSAVSLNSELNITLNERSLCIQEVVVKAYDPISEQFSVVKLNKLSIYLNPVSQGDPLKAITTLPASTNTNETANPSLRGSSPARTKVILNNVPVYNPVRSSMIDNQGFFSLFTPEIINNQYVYASNPPLIYGNTSAGLVEIQTIKNLETNQFQGSSSLASIGFFLSQKIKKNDSFIQLYGNNQFSEAFLAIQKNQLPDIKKFHDQDIGLNFHTKLSEKYELNSYHYFINESFTGFDEQYTYKGEVNTANRRFFSINNLFRHTQHGMISINNGFNISNQKFHFGNILSNTSIEQTYFGADYKWYPIENTTFQFGVSHDYLHQKFIDSIPFYYFALTPQSPTYYNETSVSNNIFETFVYSKWNMNQKLTLSSGWRANIPFKNQIFYQSYQVAIKLKINQKNDLLLSSGKYYNYSMPDFYSRNVNLLSSNQITLDYSYTHEATSIKSAIYFKNERGKQLISEHLVIDKTQIWGLEFFIEQNLLKSLRFTLSYSYIKPKVTINNRIYNGENDLKYYIKSSLEYFNSQLFSFSFNMRTRPGLRYHKIIGGNILSSINQYEPIYSEDFYSLQYKKYIRFDVNFNKYLKLKDNALIVFFTVNNIFNTKNEQKILYNNDYSTYHYDYYQFRTVYFGVVYQFNDF